MNKVSVYNDKSIFWSCNVATRYIAVSFRGYLVHNVVTWLVAVERPLFRAISFASHSCWNSVTWVRKYSILIDFSDYYLNYQYKNNFMWHLKYKSIMVIKFMIRMFKFLYGSDTWHVLQQKCFRVLLKYFKNLSAYSRPWWKISDV